MTRIILAVYDRFKHRPALGWCLAVLLTLVLGWAVSRLDYQEDISAFLPLDQRNQTALSVYQEISGANRIYAIVGTADSTDVDPDRLVEVVDSFTANVQKSDSTHLIGSITKQIDMERMMSMADSVYRLAPYLLTDADYARIDSLLSVPGYVSRQLGEARQMLLFPTSSMLAANLGRDPLNLFTSLTARLRRGGMSMDFDSYDGYILTPDGSRAIVMLESNFGAQESEHNGRLVKLLNDAAAATRTDLPGADIHIIGGPAIAAGNAGRIKSDSILAGCIAGVLILGLLLYVFRNMRNILLILVSVAWGWLFAMGAIALFYDSVSIIVIGIASVILGIAINYPLHLIDHLKDSSNTRRSLREIVSPLVVGNVTTVGAFLCLVPLNSPALHDLGLFSSLLLVGTIVFVLVLLPHLMRVKRTGAPAHEPRLITRLGEFAPENHRWLVVAVLILTMVFGYYSQRTQFDSDMRNINYMTDSQRADMAYFQSLVTPSSGTESVYIAATADNWEDALRQHDAAARAIDSVVGAGMATRQNQAADFFVSQPTQRHRLQRWQQFRQRYASLLTDSLSTAAAANGFNPQAFAQFNDILTADYAPLPYEAFVPTVCAVFGGNVSQRASDGRKTLVQVLDVPADSVAHVRAAIEGELLVFDVRSMNGSIADTLSNDFNYIGLACGCIVFVFLWLSLGCIELAIVSFLPMAFSWIWILGIMGMLGIKFNIVNIILATFIFGQGDDYTIFITEGLSYELAYRRRLLASYKNSIVVSALIMFIGIGTLVFAKHPAMRSLGEVTVVGMLSVVLMAYLLPPLLFKWLVYKNGRLRRRPITLLGLLGLHHPGNYGIALSVSQRRLLSDVELRYRYKGADIMRTARRNLRAIAPHLPQLQATDISLTIPTQGTIQGTTTTGYTITMQQPQGCNSQGELALVVALLHPDAQVRCHCDGDTAALLRAAALDYAPNITIITPTSTPA